jgi:hypothetical protein
MPYLIASIFIVIVIGVYVLFYYLNGATKAPEGCELPEDYSGCSACTSRGCVSRIEAPKISKKS